MRRWVQDNVASFGGDPRTVTVGGQSAGAYSSLLLALDPATNGSITRVLLRSGPFGLDPQDPHRAAETAAAHLGLLGTPRRRGRRERPACAAGRAAAGRLRPAVRPARDPGQRGAADVPGPRCARHAPHPAAGARVAHRPDGPAGRPGRLPAARRPSPAAPAEDPYALGATHCAELPFLFNTFDAFQGSPALAGVGDTEHALGREFATAVAEFVSTGTAGDWLPYAPATTARIRHFG